MFQERNEHGAMLGNIAGWGAFWDSSLLPPSF